VELAVDAMYNNRPSCLQLDWESSSCTAIGPARAVSSRAVTGSVTQYSKQAQRKKDERAGPRSQRQHHSAYSKSRSPRTKGGESKNLCGMKMKGVPEGNKKIGLGMVSFAHTKPLCDQQTQRNHVAKFGHKESIYLRACVRKKSRAGCQSEGDNRSVSVGVCWGGWR
jgi:hypothetical protein